MKETGIRKEVIEEIKNLARKYQVKRVILFGSRARGDYKRTSDIDIAVSGGIIPKNYEKKSTTCLKRIQNLTSNWRMYAMVLSP